MQIVNLAIQANFRRMCILDKGAYRSPHQFAPTGLFLEKVFFHLVLSKCANLSHNFTNLNFCDVIPLLNNHATLAVINDMLNMKAWF